MTTLLPLIVVVEDDLATLKAFARLLRAAGFEPATYSSAEAFLASPPARAPTCLVIDIQLGHLSGLDLQRRLLDSGSTTPVIVMTAFDDLAVRAEAMRMGCLAFFDKRAEIGGLLMLVRALGDDVAS